MNIYYNKKSLNDTILITVFDEESSYTNKISDDVILIYNNKQQLKLLAINIFNASKYFLNLKEGMLYPTKEILDQIYQLTNIKLDEYVKNQYVVGEIKEAQKIEGTHLQLCKVDTKDELLNIVCGAKNARVGLKTVVAKIGAFLPNAEQIKFSKLMNNESYGMLCSQKELNIQGFNDSGIIELDDNYSVGSLFVNVYSNLNK